MVLGQVIAIIPSIILRNIIRYGWRMSRHRSGDTTGADDNPVFQRVITMTVSGAMLAAKV